MSHGLLLVKACCCEGVIYKLMPCAKRGYCNQPEYLTVTISGMTPRSGCVPFCGDNLQLYLTDIYNLNGTHVLTHSPSACSVWYTNLGTKGGTASDCSQPGAATSTTAKPSSAAKRLACRRVGERRAMRSCNTEE